MPPAAVCPDVTQYERLAAGRLPDADKAPLLDHLESCDACARKLGALPEQDSLAGLVRQTRTLCDAASQETIVRLMERLSKLRPGQAPEAPTLPPAPLVNFKCPACGKGAKVKAELVGKPVQCPHCQAAVRASAGNEPARPPEERPLTGASAVGQTSATVAPLPGHAAPQVSYDFLAPPQAPGELGRLGPYRVLEVLGAGGMGVVFRAEDPQLARQVALKAMLPALAASAGARQRFLREARAAAAIEHDHIITIHQVGEDRGVPFVAMPLLRGEALEERLKRDAKPLLAEILRIAREIAEGLTAAHERGLIHRDIKPANIWLEGKAGRVKILDFGLARLETDTAQLTQSGAILGTPAYMAPEQARAGSADQRCDLFSLGCVLYRMATGVMPFKGVDALSMLMSVTLDDPVPPGELNSRLPPALSALVMKLLEKDPEKRVGSAHEVVEAIRALEGDSPTLAVPAPRPAARPAKARRRRALIIGAALLAVLIGGGIVLGQIILRVTDKDGKSRDIPLNPGDKLEVIAPAAPLVVPPPPAPPPAPPPEGKVASPSPFDRLRREDIPPELLKAAGRGDPNKAPAEIVAILGKPGFIMPYHSFKEDGSIGAIDLRPDGKALALGYNFTWRSRVTIWQPATGKETVIVKPDSGVTEPVPVFSHDGTLLAIKTAEKCDLWDVNLKRRWQPLSDKAYRRFFCAFTPDDHGVLIGSPDRGNKDLGDPLSLIPITGRQPAPDPVKFEQAACSVSALALSPDGATVAAAGRFPPSGQVFVKLWDVKTGKVVQTVAGPWGAFTFVVFSPDGKFLLTQQEWGADHPGIVVHDLRTGKVACTYKLHAAPPTDAAVSTDGRQAASCDENGDVHVWDPVSGQNKRVIVLNTQYGTGQIFWTPDGRHLIVHNEIGTVYILRLAPAPGD